MPIRVKTKVMTLAADEFIRRFLLHALRAGSTASVTSRRKQGKVEAFSSRPTNRDLSRKRGYLEGS